MPYAHQVTDVITDHGEGPVWFADRSELRLVDMLAGDVLTVGGIGTDHVGVTRDHFGTVTAVVRPRAEGGFVVATERGFTLVSAHGERSEIGPVFADPGIRFNEGGCLPDGSLLCGTMAYDESPGAGRMYRLDTAHTVTELFGDVTISNGLAMSPAGDRMFYVDSATGRIDVFDYEAGILSARRPFAAIEVAGAAPDGLCVDAEGGVWVALWQGGAVLRYDAAGALSERVEVPAAQVTACAFGGADNTDLFITTSRYLRGDEAEPGAGAVFAFSAGVAGAPTESYSG